jgi:ABC-2 type transport system permease protein
MNAFYWSVRRELWEHRAVWMAPLAVAGFVLVAFLLGTHGATVKVSGLSALPPDKQQQLVMMPFALAASAVMVTAFIVGAFYCLDALHAERRDRSILFWKSMPVSDAVTVLSKAAVALAVIPAVALGVAYVLQALLLVVAGVGLKALGLDAGALFERLPVFAMTVSFAYGVAAHALWYAPLYALLLLASVAVRRPFLWVVIPAIAVQILEKIAFDTAYSGALIKYRLAGAMTEAFRHDASKEAIVSLSQLDPGRFLASPGLWLGLAAAAVFLFIAIRLRRSKEPL